MKQPEALRLADALCAAPERSRTSFEAAAELRRLHEANQAMLEALGLILASDDWLEIERIARAAIAKEDQL